jgi:peptidoglycan/xylan/chitin deacetylase (PgdA/CDA1 family)
LRTLALLSLSLLSCGSPSAGSEPRAPAKPQTAPGLSVAITVDDLPVHGRPYPGIDRGKIADQLLAAFAAHRVPQVYGFVNGKRVDDDPATEAILRRWLAAGYPLGNHTWSHPSLNETPLPDYIADIEHGEAVLKRLNAFGAFKPFRYPFLFEGNTPATRDAVRHYLKQRGYTRATVTIDAEDWAYNGPFARCREIGDDAETQRLVTDYVARHVAELERARELTRRLVGRDVAHVLLLHIGAADAAAIEPLLTAYELNGVRWISLEQALSDPFHALETRDPMPFGAADPYRLAKERGVKLSSPPPDDIEARLATTCVKSDP